MEGIQNVLTDASGCYKTKETTARLINMSLKLIAAEIAKLEFGAVVETSFGKLTEWTIKAIEL